MVWIILGILISYLIGSLPTAYLFGRWMRGIDIRKFGSGNVGATNAFRVLGKGAGITVLVLDIFKGFVPVVFLGDFISSQFTPIPNEILRMILGLSCISGHNWTIFLRFKGGKGIATSFGVLLGLAAKIAGLKLILWLVIFTWFMVFFLTRIISVASVLAAVALPIYMVLRKQSIFLSFSSLILSAVIVLRHWSNLKRLLRGKEPRLF